MILKHRKRISCKGRLQDDGKEFTNSEDAKVEELDVLDSLPMENIPQILVAFVDECCWGRNDSQCCKLRWFQTWSYISSLWASSKKRILYLAFMIHLFFDIFLHFRLRLQWSGGCQERWGFDEIHQPSCSGCVRHGGSCSRKEGFGEMKMEPIGLKITPCEVVGKIS